MSAAGASAPVTGDRVTVAVLVAAATIAGTLAGGLVATGHLPGERAAPAPLSITDGGLRVEVPEGWARSAPPAVPGFRHPLGLTNAAAGLSVAVERLPVRSATLLPAGQKAGRPEDVRLASGRRAWRYRLQRRDGSMLVLYAAPVAGAVVTVACAGPAAAAIPRGCDALASTVTAPGSHALPPTPRAAFVIRAPGVVAGLDAARAGGARELSAATRAGSQAAAADRLARAHRAAAAVLAPLARERAQTATVDALSTTAVAYADLAAAARARAPRRYATASRAVAAADADLRNEIATGTAGASAPSGPAAARRIRSPAADRPGGVDGSFALLALLGACAILFAARETRRLLDA